MDPQVVGVRVALLVVAVGEDHLGAVAADDLRRAVRRPRPGRLGRSTGDPRSPACRACPSRGSRASTTSSYPIAATDAASSSMPHLVRGSRAPRAGPSPGSGCRRPRRRCSRRAWPRRPRRRTWRRWPAPFDASSSGWAWTLSRRRVRPSSGHGTGRRTLPGTPNRPLNAAHPANLRRGGLRLLAGCWGFDLRRRPTPPRCGRARWSAVDFRK